MISTGRDHLVATGVVLALLAGLAPDVDAILPWVAHRGVTHSLFAAGTLGIGVGVLGWASALSSVAQRTERAVVGFVVGLVSVTGHLLGDVITPLGVQPFFPVGGTGYTLDLVTARDPVANVALFVVGIVAFQCAVRYGRLQAGIPEPGDALGVDRTVVPDGTVGEPTGESATDSPNPSGYGTED